MIIGFWKIPTTSILCYAASGSDVVREKDILHPILLDPLGHKSYDFALFFQPFWDEVDLQSFNNDSPEVIWDVNEKFP